MQTNQDVKNQPTKKEVFETLLKYVEGGTAVLMIGIKDYAPIPTLHNFYPKKYYESINHCGFGVFSGKTEHGEFTFCAGGAMTSYTFPPKDFDKFPKTGNDNHEYVSYCTLTASKEVLADLGYNFEAVIAKLKALIAEEETAGYKAFCEQVEGWDKVGAPYGVSDLIDLAVKCHTPIPEDIKKRRGIP